MTSPQRRSWIPCCPSSLLRSPVFESPGRSPPSTSPHFSWISHATQPGGQRPSGCGCLSLCPSACVLAHTTFLAECPLEMKHCFQMETIREGSCIHTFRWKCSQRVQGNLCGLGRGDRRISNFFYYHAPCCWGHGEREGAPYTIGGNATQYNLSAKLFARMYHDP